MSSHAYGTPGFQAAFTAPPATTSQQAHDAAAGADSTSAVNMPYQARLPAEVTLPTIGRMDRFISLLTRRVFFPKQSSSALSAARERLQSEFPLAKRVKIVTPEGFRLDALHVPSQDASSEVSKRAVLFCPGADGYYEDNWSFNFIRWVKAQVGDVQVVIANYAGVQESEGYLHPQTLATSVYSSLCYLVDGCQIDPRYLTVFSQSLGGLATNLALPLVTQRYGQAPFSLVNERSMARFMPIIERMSGTGALGKAGQGLLRLGGWEVHDLEQHFAKAPGKKLVIHCPQDPTIPLEASMLSALQATQASATALLTLHPANEGENGHMRAFREDESHEIASHLRSMLSLSELPSPSELPLSSVLNAPASDAAAAAVTQ